jgi:glutamyl-tRNA reductase
VELLTWHEGADSQSEEGPDVEAFLGRRFRVDAAELRPHLYQYDGGEAVRHLFRVASSLDSMVLGEPQILGQVKESYAVARSVGAVSSNLERLLQTAFTVAKRVRTETRIGGSSVSVASVAVDLAKKIFGSLEGKRVLLVGAGKMSELAARHLIRQGATSMLIANRTFERAVEMAQLFAGRPIRFEELYASADQADIIITSTGAAQPIFRREHVQQFLHRRRNRPMFFIDIAVPRDVDPRVNQLDGVFLYDIDDLQSVTVSHLDERSREARQAEEIIRAEVERFERMLETRSVVPAIVALQQQFERVRQDEHRRIESKLRSLTPEQRSAVEALTRGLVNKVLHQPLRAMKAAARSGDMSVVEAVREIFSLQEPALEEAVVEESGSHDGDAAADGQPHGRAEGAGPDAVERTPEAATSGKATAAQPRDAKAEEIRLQESRR